MARRAVRAAADVRLESQSALRSRRMRRPSHTFRVKVRPWELVPTLFAPVLPGDTVQVANLQMRVLSKPLKDKLGGWWCEHYLFYVRFGDLDSTAQAALQQMVISNTAPTVLAAAGTDTNFFLRSGQTDFITPCYTRVVEAYFRDNDGSNTSGTYTFPSGYEPVRIGNSGFWDSFAVNDSLDDPVTGDPDDWEEKYKAYSQLRNAKLTTATWEEYLAMQGVSSPPQLTGAETAQRRPELIRFVRDFQYPVQAVEPSTGVPSALVQWSIADRLNRARFCGEPGFLLGATCVRPKVFMKNQRANAAGYLFDEAAAWMPSALDTDPHARMRMFDGVTVGGGAGPIYGFVDDYWLDPKDVLDRGDQFTNYDLGSTVAGALDGVNVVNLPASNAVNPEFPSTTDADGLFSGSDKFFEIDGIMSFGIKSRSGGYDSTGRTGAW